VREVIFSWNPDIELSKVPYIDQKEIFSHEPAYALCELLESILRQDITSLEVIIVNDFGDNISFVKELYPELAITVFEMERNSKHVHARNRGLEAASGEYIMLCDDDDLLVPGHIARMLEEIQDADLIYSDVEIFEYIRDNGIRVPTKRFVFAYEHDVPAMRKFSTFVSSGCLYRRSLHERLGPFDSEMYHYWDWDFFLRAVEHFRVRRVPVASALYAFSQDGENMSSDLNDMRSYLDKLSAKHDLGELPTKNFFLLLEEPDVVSRKAETEIVWDGKPIVSRLHGQRKL
jgi:glycosyltransferase involved in cell wall biosynthesis